MWTFWLMAGLLLASATLAGAQTLDSALGAWKPTTGEWKTARGGFVGEGSLDNRLLWQKALPESFSWTVTTQLQAGRSAGVLFWADADGKQGYVVRLDSRLGQLILARVGAWPEETRLDTFSWEPLDGAKATFRIVAGAQSVRVYVPGYSDYPVLEARRVAPFGNTGGLILLDAKAAFTVNQAEPHGADVVTVHTPQVGAFQQIYDASVGEKEPWYINDHCFIHGEDGWHLYGITHAQPADPMNEKDFAHATSPVLLQSPWTKQPYALRTDRAQGENHLWAPHVIKKGRVYYMFYCAGSQQSNYHFRIHLATSTDLKNWTRYLKNPLFQDFYDARDPMVLEDNGTYYLYYTANLDREQNNHVVNVRTSKDLLRWSPARVAFVHPERGTFGGPTESPFVVKYGDHFYLFCGPDSDYRRTVVYRSSNPLHWNYSAQVYAFPSHAAEVVQDTDGKWVVSNCGWDLTGVFLAPLTWQLE